VTAAAAIAAIALTATPARVALDGNSRATVQVTNHGRQPVVLDVSRAGFAVDLRGRPRIVQAATPAWLSVGPRRVAIPPGESAALRLTGHVPAVAAPGDHPGLLLLASRPLLRGAVAVRVRLGVLVLLRVPGRVVHRVTLGSVTRRGRVLELRVANRGNVAESLAGLAVEVRRSGAVARLHAPPRELLPHAAGVVEVPCPRTCRGPLIVRAVLGTAARTYRVRRI
jgi:hypothetical protein